MNCYCLNSKEGRKDSRKEGRKGLGEGRREGNRKRGKEEGSRPASPLELVSQGWALHHPFKLFLLDILSFCPWDLHSNSTTGLWAFSEMLLIDSWFSALPYAFPLPTHQRGSCSDQLQCSDYSFTSKARAAQRGARASQTGRCARKCTPEQEMLDRQNEAQVGRALKTRQKSLYLNDPVSHCSSWLLALKKNKRRNRLCQASVHKNIRSGDLNHLNHDNKQLSTTLELRDYSIWSTLFCLFTFLFVIFGTLVNQVWF